MANEFDEFDRTAVVTIQGGGIYGLSLLGQLDTVINNRDYKIEPLALAGTSAGSIIATRSSPGQGLPEKPGGC